MKVRAAFRFFVIHTFRRCKVQNDAFSVKLKMMPFDESSKTELIIRSIPFPQLVLFHTAINPTDSLVSRGERSVETV
jgi:hypothetical protein